MWTDRCQSDDKTHLVQEVSNCLVITYCIECKTVEVYSRWFFGTKGCDTAVHITMKPFV